MTNEPLFTVEGDNGKIDLLENSIIISLYKKELFKLNKSKFNPVYEIPKDLLVYAKVISKDAVLNKL